MTIVVNVIIINSFVTILPASSSSSVHAVNTQREITPPGAM